MKLSLIITQNCAACNRAESALRNLSIRYPEISLDIIDANDYDGQSINIIPALFINDELFSYGDLDESELLVRFIKQK